MTHTSFIELSRKALANNLGYLHNLIGDECKLSLVVKGNAYGHGIRSYIPLAADLGQRHFSTFDANEALEVYKATSQKLEIMIMGMIGNEELEWAIENDIEFYVFEMDRLRHALKTARKTGKKARIHVEFETGMNRTGFEPELREKVIQVLLKNQNYLMLKGVCTHYAGAESYANFLRVNQQYEAFRAIQREIRQTRLEPMAWHTASSAATIRLPHTRMNMVRVGILQYGYWPSMETFITTIQPKASTTDANPLQRIISWKSRVMSVKEVVQGEYVGYGTSYLAIQDMKIAVVPIGYGYGYSRSLSNTGRALIRGERVSVVGIVNMNAILLDITQVPGVQKGDEVVLIGQQGNRNISVSSFGEFSDQLNYELLTRLPTDIPRKVVE